MMRFDMLPRLAPDFHCKTFKDAFAEASRRKASPVAEDAVTRAPVLLRRGGAHGEDGMTGKAKRNLTIGVVAGAIWLGLLYAPGPDTPASGPAAPEATVPAVPRTVLNESGAGPGKVSFNLPRGRYRAEVSVAGNMETSFGRASATNAIFSPESMAGTPMYSWMNEIAASYSDFEVFRIRRASEEIWLRIDVAPAARWTVKIARLP